MTEHLTGGYWRTGREQGNLTGEERRREIVMV
jgi:hypothetical protein